MITVVTNEAKSAQQANPVCENPHKFTYQHWKDFEETYY